MKKLIFAALVLMSVIPLASADPALINVPYTDSTKTFTYDENTYTEFVPAADNAITKIEITLSDGLCTVCYWANDTGVMVQLSSDTFYNVTATKTDLGADKTLREVLTVSGTKIFDASNRVPILFPTDDYILVSSELPESVNTTFNDVDYMIGPLGSSQSVYVSAVPSSDVVIYGLTNFSVKITVMYIPGLQQRIEQLTKVQNLNPILKFIYDVFYHIPLVGESVASALVPLLQIIDLFILLVSLFLKLIYFYPYCLAIYIMTGGNIVGAVKGRTHREILFAMRDYYVWIGEKAWVLFSYILTVVARIITAITNMIP